MSKLKRWSLRAGAGLGAVLAAAAVWLWTSQAAMEREIEAQHQRLKRLPAGTAPAAGRAAWQALPMPVQRYLAFAFPSGPGPHVTAEMSMEGRFRRPQTTTFMPTTARQSASSAQPALMFDATTPVAPGIQARVYDAYIGGQMVMQARLLSALTVLDERSSPLLDRISLRRWLLESPLYPQALLPGGAVAWEAVADDRARAVVRFGGAEASLLARFAPDGSLLSFEAEEDGDLGTPYHGSGEHVARGDYRLVDGVRVPMRFVISRRSAGVLHPFWDGRVVRLRLQPPVAAPYTAAPGGAAGA